VITDTVESGAGVNASLAVYTTSDDGGSSSWLLVVLADVLVRLIPACFCVVCLLSRGKKLKVSFRSWKVQYYSTGIACELEGARM